MTTFKCVEDKIEYEIEEYAKQRSLEELEEYREELREHMNKDWDNFDLFLKFEIVDKKIVELKKK